MLTCGDGIVAAARFDTLVLGPRAYHPISGAEQRQDRATEAVINASFLLGCAGFLIYPVANKASTAAQEANRPGEWQWWLL